MLIYLFSKMVCRFSVFSATYAQNFFTYCLKLCYLAMNIGGGGEVVSSGEVEVLKYLKNKFIKSKNFVLFDVGANKGEYSLQAAKIFKSQLYLFAFEPSLTTFNLLKSKINSGNNIILNNFGLGCATEQKILFSDSTNSTLASVYKRNLEHHGMAFNNTETIKISTLDEYCKNNNIHHINLLKIDTEGNELDVLSGAKEMIRKKSVDYIQFEFGGCNIDSRTYLKDFFYFLGDRYNIYRVLKKGIIRIEKYDESQEVFLTTNYLAERK